MTAPRTAAPDDPTEASAAAPTGAPTLATSEVPVAAIALDPDQPRRSFSDARLDLLAEDIRVHGVIEPLVVRPHPDAAARAATPYMLVVGQRRLTAAGRAGLPAVPVVVRDDLDLPADRLMLQIAENDGELREDLTLYELATAVARAYELDGGSQKTFAHRHRRSRPWLSEMLAVARAEGLAAEALRENLLQGVLAVRTFIRLGPYQQHRLLKRARKYAEPITVTVAEKAAGRPDRPDPADSTDSADSLGPDTRRPPGPAAGRPALPAAAQPPATSPTASGRAAPLEAPTQTPHEIELAGAPAPSPAALPTADPSASSAVPAAPATLPAGAAPASRHDHGPPRLSILPVAPPDASTPALPASARSAAAGFLDAGETLGRLRILPTGSPPPAPRPGESRVWIELTLEQLEQLLILLGLEPEGPPQEQVRQLLNCL
ncbi:MAG TPA: ParB/RepB/Spo0J family partition protein [Thermoanaerobaculia bacterium]|nr:ParB/RepB/Spo0J family partition protein [Thermoanaerobaculia bacterium]